jgi:hypothetical protein
MKKLYIVLIILSSLLYASNICAQAASSTWMLNNASQLTSVNAGNITGSVESISPGSGQFGMNVFDYSADGQRLWEGVAGWLAGSEELTRFIQFDALPAGGNSLTVNNVSFNYGAVGVDNNIQSNAYYSIDGWITRTPLNQSHLAYPGSSMLSFTQNLSVTISSGATFSVRIYPYSIVNSSPLGPTFAVHNNVVISGTVAAKKNCVILVTNVAGKWGKSVLLTARLQETGPAGNTNLPGKKVSMGTRESDTCDCPLGDKFNSSGTTDANGVVSIAYTIPQDSILSSMKAPQDSVAHTIKAEFTGDANYNAISGTGKLIVVRHVASLTVVPTTAVFGQPVVFTATLMDNDNGGKGVSNQSLKFYKISPGTRLGDTSRAYIGSGKTNSNGVASISYTLPQDSVISSISVSFAGDANYSPKNGTGIFTNTLKNSILQVTNIAGKWGKSVLLTSRLQETGPAGNTNLPNRKISFSRESDTCDCPNAIIRFIGSGTTDANGIASISYTIPQDSVLSSMKAPQDSVAHTIKAEFAGDANYNPQSILGKLTVVRHVASLTVSSTTAVFGQPVVFSATLIDNDNSGNGISKQLIKLYLDKVYVNSGTTNASGVASISFTGPQDSVSHSITTSFAGDANYSSQSSTVTLNFTLKNSVIQITNVAGKWGKSVLLTARLQETGVAGNTNLPNKKISFSRESDTANVPIRYIGSGTTDANGIASISYTIPQDSILSSMKAPQDSVAHTITVSFAGDAKYNPQNISGKLMVVRHVASLTVSPTTAVIGQPVVFSATLIDNDNSGKGVSNQSLKFYKIGPGTKEGDTSRAYIGSGKTNANGVASMSYILPQDSVISSISVSFAGNVNYSSQNATGKFTYTLTGVEKNPIAIPTKFDLLQNYPNPFNPTTTINYQLPQSGFVTIKVFDILGREVATLVHVNKQIGYYSANFDAGKLTSGIYFYTIRVNNYIESKKMLLLK